MLRKFKNRQLLKISSIRALASKEKSSLRPDVVLAKVIQLTARRAGTREGLVGIHFGTRIRRRSLQMGRM